ncbi:MAG: ribonuclease HI family protein [Deltaproteobacteria bacterium]|jgi:ribonuclease HI|nr:ribonuclease HI family protein [Deltaproteobacteria bacterium]
MNLTVYTDGASRGNPGKSGAGVLILDENKQKIASLNKYLGILTNNEAEYKALIISLEFLSDMADKGGIGEMSRKDMLFYAELDVLFLLDSQLLVNQMNGVYSVKSANILPLYNKAQKLLKDIKALLKIRGSLLKATFRHIPRELNKEADKLANLAIDTSIACIKAAG